MGNRLKAALGSIGHAIETAAASLLSLIGLRSLARFSVPALIALLAVVAVLSARDTIEILGSRPDVTRTTLSEVGAYEGEGGSIWYQFDALVDDTSLSTPADLGTFFYLARDPADPDSGLLVRSPLNDAFFRQRVVGAEIVEDSDLVAATLESLPPLPPGLSVDRTRFLDEREHGGDSDSAFEPSELAEEPAGSMVLVAGRVVAPSSYAACVLEEGCEGEEAAWMYVLADLDGGDAILLRSPHPPSLLPVSLQGLYQRDTFDLDPVLESDWFAGLDADVPTGRALSAGSRPPVLVEASWLPTTLAAGGALLLLASYLVGYPVFASGTQASRRSSLDPGDRVAVEITGRLARGDRSVTLERSPGTVERLGARELGLRLWRYGLLPPGESREEAERRFVEESAGTGARLVVNEPDQSMLVVVERDPAAAQARAGRLYRLAGSVPAVHLRQGATDLYLAVNDEGERDRLAAELSAEAGTG